MSHNPYNYLPQNILQSVPTLSTPIPLSASMQQSLEEAMRKAMEVPINMLDGSRGLPVFPAVPPPVDLGKFFGIDHSSILRPSATADGVALNSMAHPNTPESDGELLGRIVHTLGVPTKVGYLEGKDAYEEYGWGKANGAAYRYEVLLFRNSPSSTWQLSAPYLVDCGGTLTDIWHFIEEERDSLRIRIDNPSHSVAAAKASPSATNGRIEDAAAGLVPLPAKVAPERLIPAIPSLALFGGDGMGGMPRRLW